MAHIPFQIQLYSIKLTRMTVKAIFRNLTSSQGQIRGLWRGVEGEEHSDELGDVMSGPPLQLVGVVSSLPNHLEPLAEHMRVQVLYLIVERPLLLAQSGAGLEIVHGLVDAAIYEAYKVLLVSCKAMAPLTSFLTEVLYQNMRKVSNAAEESIHHCSFPEAEGKIF